MELCIVIPFLKDPHYQMYYIMNSFLFQVIVVEFLELYTLYSQYVISLWKKTGNSDFKSTTVESMYYNLKEDSG